MSLFSSFYFATIAILLGMLSISLPILLVRRIYKIASQPFIEKYSATEDFEDNPELIFELFEELKNSLEKKEEYENLKKIHKTVHDFKRRKITTEEIFNHFELITEEVENGDMRANPERGCLINSYSYSEDDGETTKVTRYGYLKFKKSFSVKEFVKRLLFSDSFQ